MPAAEPTPTEREMTNDELDARLVGLRATLTRAGIALDDVPRIESCHSSHGGRCVKCEVARRDNTAGLEPSLIDSAALAFAMYPPKLLAAARVEHVALCRRIEVADGEMAPAGMALLGEDRILVSIGSFEELTDGWTIDRVIHHELFHMLDYRGEHFDIDPEWEALNPKGFAYADPEGHYRDRDLPAARPKGFVRSYATQNEAEDRASTYEHLISQPDELCAIAAKDPIVAKKVALIRKRVSKIAAPDGLFSTCKKAPPPTKKRGPIDLRVRTAP